MGKLLCKDNKGFSFIEVISVLFIVSIIIIILSFNPVQSFDKYKEKIAVNNIVSDIYLVQTKSLNSDKGQFINFFENSDEYVLYYDGERHWKKVDGGGKTGTGARDIKFKFINGKVNVANTVLVMFDNSTYEIIIHLETGYITVNER